MVNCNDGQVSSSPLGFLNELQFIYGDLLPRKVLECLLLILFTLGMCSHAVYGGETFEDERTWMNVNADTVKATAWSPIDSKTIRLYLPDDKTMVYPFARMSITDKEFVEDKLARYKKYLEKKKKQQELRERQVAFATAAKKRDETFHFGWTKRQMVAKYGLPSDTFKAENSLDAAAFISKVPNGRLGTQVYFYKGKVVVWLRTDYNNDGTQANITRSQARDLMKILYSGRWTRKELYERASSWKGGKYHLVHLPTSIYAYETKYAKLLDQRKKEEDKKVAQEKEEFAKNNRKLIKELKEKVRNSEARVAELEKPSWQEDRMRKIGEKNGISSAIADARKMQLDREKLLHREKEWLSYYEDCLSAVKSGRPLPPGPGTWAGAGDDAIKTAITSKKDNIITTQDGGVWLVNSFEKFDTTLWMPYDNVIIIEDSTNSPAYGYDWLIINPNDKTQAHAKKLK